MIGSEVNLHLYIPLSLTFTSRITRSQDNDDAKDLSVLKRRSSVVVLSFTVNAKSSGSSQTTLCADKSYIYVGIFLFKLNMYAYQQGDFFGNLTSLSFGSIFCHCRHICKQKQTNNICSIVVVNIK